MSKFQDFLNTTINNKTGFLLTSLVTLIIIVWWSYNPWPFSSLNNGQAFQIFVIIYLLFTFIYGYFIYFNPDSIPNPDRPIWDIPTLSDNVGTTVYVFVFMTLVLILSIYGIFKLCNDVNIAYIITNYSLNIMMMLGFMGIIYLSIKPLLKSGGSKTSEFLKMLFFYLPCLWIDVVEYLKKQYKITTPTIWILLLSEIVLITCYFILPRLINKINFKNGTMLQGPPIYLNNENTVGTYENLHKKNEKIVTKKSEQHTIANPFLYNYSISFWFYLNPQPPNTNESYSKYTNILNYGKRPQIEYNGEKNTLRVQCLINDNTTEEIYSTNKILYQRWNNLVINCDEGNMDVFLNNELVTNKINIAPLMTYEKIVTGSKDGIHGGICNIMYHNKVLTKNEIDLNYSIFKNLSPPVLNNF